jgi:lysophospholipase L1-like esterase
MPEEQKPAGSIRILAIGDSTTFGWGVNDQDTYVARLQARLARAFPDRAIRAINGGVSGYDLKRDERLFRSFQPTLRPDIVIVGLFWNDLPYEVVTPDGTRLAPEQTSPVSLGDVDVVPTQGAAAGGRPFRIGNMPPTGLTRWLRASRLLFVLRHAWLSFLSPSSAATNEVQWEMALLNGRQSAAIDDAWRDVEGTLANIATFCHDTGVDVGILVLPIRAQVEKAYPNAAYQTRVRDIAARLGMFLIDPLPQFLQARDHTTLFIPYDRMHFSARGNALLADTVFTTLQHRSALAGTLGAQTVRP